ncbi:MAG TPA: ABC transporter ATP-binding protein [Rickettsia endosymbiont of Columbicola hoogstraali]|nr:ABC transporter ATP-binding protein [Rickettsia endosymbiont of Columbicola hoogstraali]
MNHSPKPIPFLWSVIKLYKHYYLIRMIAPVASGVYPTIYNYAVKLVLDLFTQNEQITFAQSYKPIMVFIAAQALLDGAWRAHNFAQLKSLPYVFQGIMNKICNHYFNLPYSYFQDNLSAVL